MTARDFCFWLQGFFEINKAGEGQAPRALNAHKTHMIEKHLSLVFAHEIDPSAGAAAHQAALNKLHGEGAEPANPVVRC